ncbi:MAG: hypothetical protein HY549_06025 [Elusimicrobia bacterium]|nr:hypothetical protein [Elusimicrobiota bacterium]
MKCLFILACAVLASPALAQDKINELERKIEALSQEVERMKLGQAAEPAAAETSIPGEAPAASKIYRSPAQRVSIGGYGEFIYENNAGRNQKGDASGQRDATDLLRAVLYFGYKYNDWILFNSEIEFEHATTGSGTSNRGEVSVEQAYVDFRLHDYLGIRAGNVLVPMGLINEVHEPTTFHGVQRPSVERTILPSTWRENGAGLFGAFGPLRYRSYLVTGLHGVATSNPTSSGFNASNGVRDARTSGAKTFAEDGAWVSRVDVSPVAGVLAGASLYLGQADQELTAANIPLTLWDLHGQAEWRGVELRGVYVEGRIGNADSVNQAQGLTGQNSIGRRLFGGYAEAAFNALSLTASRHYLAPFFRYERYDTQMRVPGGFSKNPANSRVEYALGLTYKPIPQIAAKTDYKWRRNQARTGSNIWSLGLAYIF